MSSRFVRLVLATMVVAGAASTAIAQSFSVNPVADAFVFSGEAGFNYGGAGIIAVSAPGLPAGEFQSLLRFDLAGAKSAFDLAFGPGNWTVGSAVLQLAAASPNNPIFNAPGAGQVNAIWLENDSWIEGTGMPTSPGASGVSWTSLPTVLSASDQDMGTFAFAGSSSGTASYPLTISSGLMGDTLAGGLASFRLRAAPGDANLSGIFRSRSFSTVTARPLLTLGAVVIPEPATWILAGCGLVAFGFLQGPRRLREGRGQKPPRTAPRR